MEEGQWTVIRDSAEAPVAIFKALRASTDGVDRYDNF